MKSTTAPSSLLRLSSVSRWHHHGEVYGGGAGVQEILLWGDDSMDFVVTRKNDTTRHPSAVWERSVDLNCRLQQDA